MQQIKIITFDELFSNDEILLSQLPSMQGEVIQIRGFWYPISQEEGILAAQPNLKSCCLKRGSRSKQHLNVKGDVGLFPEQKAVTVQGTFSLKKNSLATPSNEQLYILEKSIMVPSSSFPESDSIINIIAFIIIAALIFCLRRIILKIYRT